METNDKKGTNISRRNFFQTTLTGAIGAAIIPSSFLILPSHTRVKGVNDKLHMAHVGVGANGTAWMTKTFLPTKESMSIAVCDVHQKRRETAAETVNNYYKTNGIASPECKSYLDFEEILMRKDIDALYISTPDHWHTILAIKAAIAGKHIVLAKPLGISYPDYLKLKKAVKDNNVRFHYGTQQRTADHLIVGRDLIMAGAIGEIERVEVWCPGKNDVKSPICNEVPVPPTFDFDKWTGPAPLKTYCPDRVTNNSSWFQYDYSIGFLAGWGAHPLDIMVWVLKDQVDGVYSCEGTGEYWPAGGIYDNIYSWDVNYKYKAGLEVRFASLDIASKGMLDYRDFIEDNGTTFYGSKGWISLSRSTVQSNIPEINKKLNNYPKAESGKFIGSSLIYGNMGDSFINIVKGKQKELCPLDEAIISDTISHMADIAIRVKRSVTWDPKKGEVINDPEANKLFAREARSPYAV